MREGTPRGFKHDIDRCPVGKERHVFRGNDPRDHALVTVPARHLVADRELSLLGDVDLGQLHDAGRELVTDLDLVLLVLELFFDAVDLVVVAS